MAARNPVWHPSLRSNPTHKPLSAREQGYSEKNWKGSLHSGLCKALKLVMPTQKSGWWGVMAPVLQGT